MIKSFADKATQELYTTGRFKRMPADLARRALRRLVYISLATRIEDLQVPPSNRLHGLSGSVNDRWRICFRFVDGDAYDVELTDYH